MGTGRGRLRLRPARRVRNVRAGRRGRTLERSESVIFPGIGWDRGIARKRRGHARRMIRLRVRDARGGTGGLRVARFGQARQRAPAGQRGFLPARPPDRFLHHVGLMLRPVVQIQNLVPALQKTERKQGFHKGFRLAVPDRRNGYILVVHVGQNAAVAVLSGPGPQGDEGKHALVAQAADELDGFGVGRKAHVQPDVGVHIPCSANVRGGGPPSRLKRLPILCKCS